MGSIASFTTEAVGQKGCDEDVDQSAGRMVMYALQLPSEKMLWNTLNLWMDSIPSFHYGNWIKGKASWDLVIDQSSASMMI